MAVTRACRRVVRTRVYGHVYNMCMRSHVRYGFLLPLRGAEWHDYHPMDCFRSSTGATFVELFQQLCAGSLECLQEYAVKLQQCYLTRAFMGPTRDALVAVDVNLPVSDVCCQFGSYVRLNCEKRAEDPCPSVSVHNAFQIMMMNQKSLSKD